MAVVRLGFVSGRLSMLVVPEGSDLDPERYARFLDLAVLPDEAEVALSLAFPESVPGAIPPIGCLWRMPVYLDESFLLAPVISFYAGDFSDIISIHRHDFMRLVDPIVVRLASWGSSRMLGKRAALESSTHQVSPN